MEQSYRDWGGNFPILSGTGAEAGHGRVGGWTSSRSWSRWKRRRWSWSRWNVRVELQLVGLEQEAGTAAGRGGPGAVAGGARAGRSRWSAVAVERDAARRGGIGAATTAAPVREGEGRV
ncbi:hypothetical protein CDL15_Pgr019401 [Punica granatum]|uniref:Uncharacterized protein n=1 Tax=Punica granatum TaxID=22663 RepID=A0A218XS19_PUNGR|nr:hypothetical protein CDL15_Pgr019401 [Punica granatum]PKI71861.1 hypothetical protein CRG98_007720 [Punica granatum]